MTKRKSQPKQKTPEQIKRREAVRAYAAPLLAAMVAKQRSERLPDDKMKRTLAIGCMRWAVLILEQEDRYCTMEDDVEERKEFQDAIDGVESA